MGKLAWFFLGLVLGAAIALAAVTLSGRERREEPVESDRPVVTRIPEEAAAPSGPTSLSPAPTPPPVRTPEPTVAPPSVEDEAQIAEDAAAAGMTSRSRREPEESAPAASDTD